ncbi:GWxTD domain-containing protein [bacterium]|nr:GWxTD domain-containing protein [FCB group bacterium]MBL7191064.1 GWxTD domain-containing protein [bacterium]
MKKLLIIIAVSIITGSALGNPVFTIDHASFRSGDVILLDIYTLLQRNSLVYKSTESANTAEFTILYEIKQGDSVLASNERKLSDQTDDLSKITPVQKIPDQASFLICEGRYIAAVTVTDNINQKRFRREIELKIKEFDYNTLAVSDIELASALYPVSDKGKFVKKNYIVIPYADKMFGGNIKKGYFYSEFYNLTPGSDEKEYTVRGVIVNDIGQVVETFSEKKLPQRASSALEVDSFSIANLITGTYKLRLELTDGRSGQRASAEKTFWVLKSIPQVDTNPNVAFSRISMTIDSLSDEEIEKELEYIIYLAKKDEQKQIMKLNPAGGRLFLKNFWQKKAEENVFRQIYLYRIMTVNDRYSFYHTEGWQTDRGRTLILFGEPYSVRRVNRGDTEFFNTLYDHSESQASNVAVNLLSNNGYEIWFYDKIEGGIVFVFLEEQYENDYRQVYSSKTGEYSDIVWLEAIESLNPSWFRH